jgi:hypothetical protein
VEKMIYIKNIAGSVTTAAVLCYAYLGNQCLFIPEQEYVETKAISMPANYDYNPYYTVLREGDINEQIETIHNFVSNLLENSQELNPNFAKTINKHFWDLV